MTSTTATTRLASADSEESHKPYQYQDLTEPNRIRVIGTKITRENGELSCQLYETTADPSSTYHCLSYTWGNPLGSGSESDIWLQTHRIQVSGPGPADCGYLLVGRNLHDFLEEFERCEPDDIEYLWIDAICINQNNLDERAAQVGFMNAIYTNCRAVIVWFGVDDDNAAAAFTMLPHLDISDYTSKFRGGLRGDSAAVDMPRVYAALNMPQPPADVLLSAARFLRRSWLYRVWTLQETMLPREGMLWCGSLRTPLRSLGHLISLMRGFLDVQLHPVLRNARRGQPDRVGRAQNLRDTFQRIVLSRTKFLKGAMTDVSRARDNDCTDPRDKLYGLLGMMKEGGAVTVDYTKPVEDVYLEWARMRSLIDNLIHLEDPSTRVTAGLPSWVPDLCVPQLPRPWPTQGGWMYTAGTAGDFQDLQLESADPRILPLLALEEDKVAAIGASYHETIEGGDGLLSSLNLLHDQLDNLGAPVHGDHVEDFWRTLIANLPGNSPRHPESDEFGPSFRSLARHIIALHMAEEESSDWVAPARSMLVKLGRATNARHLPDWDEILQLAEALRAQGANDESGEVVAPAAVDVGGGVVKDVVEAMEVYLTSFDRMFFRRRFFVTTKGRLAVGPQVLTPGDRVFVIAGCRYPYVLRESDGGNNRYRILGEAYVQGIMFGEALEGEGRLQRVEIE